jgi:hypothetical protein
LGNVADSGAARTLLRSRYLTGFSVGFIADKPF